MEVFKPELAIFNPPEIQTSIINGAMIDIRPENVDVNQGPLEFEIKASDHDYLDLNDTMLYIKLRIFKGENKASLIGTDDVAFINLPLYSIFSDVTVKFNGVEVDSSYGFYGYNSIITSLISYSQDTLENQLQPFIGFVKDESGKMDDKSNTGHVARKAWSTAPMEFMGRLQCNVLQQPKYLIPGVNVRISLTRTTSEFALMSFTDGLKPAFEILGARLTVKKVAVSEQVRREHESALARTNAIYVFPQKLIKMFTINTGMQDFIKENLFDGYIPKFLLVTFVSANSYNGLYNKNPYNFQHFNVEEVKLTKENQEVPFAAYKPDFSSKSYLREFMYLYMGLGLSGRDETLAIKHKDFSQGYTFFVYNLTPDMSLTNAQPEGALLSLSLKFKPALSEPVKLLVYAIFDGIYEIDSNRMVFKTNIF